MKKLIFVSPLLFLAISLKAQFNTASYEQKAATVEVSPIEENQFQNTFLNYHLEGISNKKRLKEAKKKEKELAKAAKDIEQKMPAEADQVLTTASSTEATTEKKVVYKKLKPITEENFDYLEKQVVFMPLNNMVVTSRFGSRYHPIDKEVKFHAGVDLRASDRLVYSVLDGIVLDAGYSTENGNYMKILHKGNFETIYLHLSKIYYSKDTPIKAGDIIGQSGNTGKSAAPHLHFAVKENGRYVDPVQFLNDLIQTNNALSDYGK